MRIAIIGAGGVGAVFGAALQQAGAEVAFVARGAHLQALQTRGLTIRDQAGATLSTGAVTAVDDPAAIGPVDLVILTVKLWDLAAAAAAIRPLIGPATLVLPLQNGVEAADIIAAALPGPEVLGGVAYVSARIEAPGVIRQTGTMRSLAFGHRNGSAGETVRALDALCRAAGIKGGASDRIEAVLWEKLTFLASVAGVGSATRQPIGVMRAVPETRALLAAAFAEIVAVGRARGVALAADLAERTMATVDGLPEVTRSSMQQDLEAGGRLELPWLSGAVVRLGAAAGVPTPAHAALLGVLAPYVEGRR
ncbi:MULTISPECIES: ketopantoate reductase family protein [Inquilinus]|uniref:2-dehydropantoate 2-reductase n=1 Tax=Inquilinus ginsengisoli TaxID=363840 RepID=A0ABU1JP60_9PROT|nr:2-dehydropantoate 2-reductase [Inquilinus ginsengisoli]MDR6290401.1 2-dehydropantoate 2-reductase [Inquilinus ginsengisoli]